jgi:hypothetical protein
MHEALAILTADDVDVRMLGAGSWVRARLLDDYGPSGLTTIVGDLQADDTLRPGRDWDEVDGAIFILLLDRDGPSRLSGYFARVLEAVRSGESLDCTLACEIAQELRVPRRAL